MSARIKTWVPGCGDPDCGCTVWATARASFDDAMAVAVHAIAGGGRVKTRVRRKDGVMVITVTDPTRRDGFGGTPAAIFFF